MKASITEDRRTLTFKICFSLHAARIEAYFPAEFINGSNFDT